MELGRFRLPFLLSTLPTPTDLAEVRAADLDGDGRQELVLVSRIPKGKAPDAVRLTVVRFDANAKELSRTAVELGQRPLIWDLHAGIYAIDGEGVQNLLTGARIASRRTILGSLGATTPIAADFVHDVDKDGKPEFALYAAGKVWLYRSDGSEWGSVALPQEGNLRVEGDRGGARLSAAASWPRIAFGDLDGNGIDDLLISQGTRLTVGKISPGGLERLDLTLPVDLDPHPDPGRARDKERLELDGAWLRDLDGDGKVDLVTHHWVVGSTFFGATAEITWARGTGLGFSPPVRFRTNSAVLDVRLVDQEGDRDLDLLCLQADLGLANIARALVSKRVELQLASFPWAGGLTQQPKTLATLSFSVMDPDGTRYELEGDLNGDRRPDLIVHQAEGGLRAQLSSSTGFNSAADLSWPGALPPGDDPLFAADLTGDGRAELLVWGPGRKEATLLRVP